MLNSSRNYLQRIMTPESNRQQMQFPHQLNRIHEQRVLFKNGNQIIQGYIPYKNNNHSSNSELIKNNNNDMEILIHNKNVLKTIPKQSQHQQLSSSQQNLRQTKSNPIDIHSLQMEPLNEELATIYNSHHSCDVCSFETICQKTFYLHLKDHYEEKDKVNDGKHEESVDPSIDQQLIQIINEQSTMSNDKPINIDHYSNNVVNDLLDDLQTVAGTVKSESDDFIDGDSIEPNFDFNDNDVLDEEEDDNDCNELKNISNVWFEPIPNPVENELEHSMNKSNIGINIDEIHIGELMKIPCDNSGTDQNIIRSKTTRASSKMNKQMRLKNDNTVPKNPTKGKNSSITNVINDTDFNQSSALNGGIEDLLDSNSLKINKKRNSKKCDICDKLCHSTTSYQYHLLTHSGKKKYQCESCGKAFFANSALKIHMRLHTGSKPYACNDCGHAFRQWGDLKYHIASKHSEEKNHQCEFCGKEFARRYSLVIHRRIHTGERNYVCEYCKKTFRASSYLTEHRKIHTGEKPHACQYCPRKFRIRSDLKRHINIHMRAGTKDKLMVLEVLDPVATVVKNGEIVLKCKSLPSSSTNTTTKSTSTTIQMTSPSTFNDTSMNSMTQEVIIDDGIKIELKIEASDDELPIIEELPGINNNKRKSLKIKKKRSPNY